MNATTSARTPGRDHSAYSAPIELLLSRLDRVQQIAPNRWRALCPAHEDRVPSLYARLSDDGVILLHDFGRGCSAAAIVAAVGLKLSDLFPPRPEGHYRGPLPKHERPYLSKQELVAIIRRDVLRIAVAAENLVAGMVLTAEDLELLREVSTRLLRTVEGAA